MLDVTEVTTHGKHSLLSFVILCKPHPSTSKITKEQNSKKPACAKSYMQREQYELWPDAQELQRGDLLFLKCESVDCYLYLCSS